MTTFQDRKLVRDDLVTLFLADGSWQDVYGYMPAPEAFLNSPVLIIRSAGTQQEMEGANTTPTEYSFVLESYVLAFDENDDTWTGELAENEVDNLDVKLRQIIHDAKGTTNSDLLRFDTGFSIMTDALIGHRSYIVESRTIVARLNNGAI